MKAMSTMGDQAVRIEVEEGVSLDGRLHLPADAAMGSVFCHPHPLHEGTMDNKVVSTFHRAMRDVGAACLRFDFRGNRESTGTYDDGVGEQRDLARAIGLLTEELPPGAPIVIGGYSFGSAVALAYTRAQIEPRPAGLILVAPPCAFHSLLADLPPPDAPRPLTVVCGTQDEFCPIESLDQWVNAAEVPLSVFRIEGADHFFTGHGAALRRLADQIARSFASRVVVC